MGYKFSMCLNFKKDVCDEDEQQHESLENRTWDNWLGQTPKFEHYTRKKPEKF